MCKKWKNGHEPTDTPPTSIPTGHCLQDGSYEFNGYCYKFIHLDGGLTWDEAVQACGDQANNYQLASVHSERESAFIMTMYAYLPDENKATIFWFGATDQDEEGKWYNVDSTPFDYTNWEGNEPNNQVKG